jgi:F-type H+-transporting ATPase subunit a
MADGHSPLDQFNIKVIQPLPELFGYNIDFTNTSFAMVLAVILAYFFLRIGMKNRTLVPHRMQSVVEVTYEFVSNTLKENAGEEARPYFPVIFTLFMFVLMCNLLGMIPYQFTATSHIIVTFALAAAVFLGVTLIGLVKHGIKFFGLFLPHGTPWWIAPLIIIIELLAYLSRPISLSIRLTANMVAGHLLLKIVAGFVVSMIASGIILSIVSVIPFALIVVLTGFEIGIAILHAYVFTLLTCVYLNDALHLH